MTPKHYIFDFDGTLMDTQAVILATIQATIKQMGLPERTIDQCRSIIGIRTDEAGHHLYPDADVNVNDTEFARIFRENYERLRAQAAEQLFPGVRESLEQLRAQGIGMAIASSRREGSLREYLRGLGIEDWFQEIVGAESVTHGKPAPDPVLLVLERTGWKAEDTLVVGDADVDILMGRAAGCPTCAVSYGNGTLDALQAAAPDYFADTFAQCINPKD